MWTNSPFWLALLLGGPFFIKVAMIFCTAGDTSAGLTRGVLVVGEGILSSSGITFVVAGGMVEIFELFVGKTVPSYDRQIK